jgi:acetolactate synthase-1/3 small subunit
MTIVARGDELVLEQIVKQLNKLVDVIKVVDMSGESVVEREMALIKINVEGKSKEELMSIVDIFKVRVLDVSNEVFIVEMSGTDDEINGFLSMINGFGIKEMSRTGTIAMTRTKKIKSHSGKEK